MLREPVDDVHHVAGTAGHDGRRHQLCAFVSPICKLYRLSAGDDREATREALKVRVVAYHQGESAHRSCQWRASARSSEDKLKQTTWFSFNWTRQCSYVFGIDAARTFLKTAIIRAHEVQFDVDKMRMINGQTQILRVITMFSTPNF